MKKWLVAALLIVSIIVAGGGYLYAHNTALLNPQGPVGEQERRLFGFAVLLALTVLIPVYGLTIGIVLTYRASNKKAVYTPEWDHHWGVEAVRWTVFCTVIGILAVVCWLTSHALDPQKALSAQAKPMTIQVVALRWKWLFIYPEQQIATVNFVEFPEKTPVTFELTADAPMNSFWIPQLGGQMYAMSGMVNKLNLMADRAGEFAGSDAEISGAGFAGMRFTAKSVTTTDFDQWVATTKRSSNSLGLTTYQELASPSENTPVTMYASVAPRLYDTILMKYMAPTITPAAGPSPTIDEHMSDMPGM